MRDWPKGPKETAQFSDLADPVVEAIRFGYTMARRRATQDVPYQGYDIGEREKATCLLPDDQLTAEQLRYSEEDQGRDLLTEAIGIAVRLGIEQGRRLALNDH